MTLSRSVSPSMRIYVRKTLPEPLSRLFVVVSHSVNERGMWTETGASKRFSDCLDTSRTSGSGKENLESEKFRCVVLRCFYMFHLASAIW